MSRIAVALVVLVLTGCEESSVYDQWSGRETAETADIARVNAVNALARISDLESQVQELEGTVDDLTSRLESEEDAREELSLQVQEFAARYNMHTH